MALSVGARLGPYEIVGAIGAGGMGEVYKARDTRLDRTVAIKMMSVPIVPGSSFNSGKPIALFPADQYYVNVARDYDVSSDGKRFLFLKSVPPARRPTLSVITHWFDEVLSIAGRKN